MAALAAPQPRRPAPLKPAVPGSSPMPADSASSIDRFIDALWLEDGLSPNTLAAYRLSLIHI